MTSKAPVPPPVKEPSPIWIKCLSIGTEVMIHGDISAVIVKICLEGVEVPLTTYQCSWFADKTNHRVWFQSHEITPIKRNIQRTAMGFIPPVKCDRDGW